MICPHKTIPGDDSLLMTADITQDKAVIEKAYLDFDGNWFIIYVIF